jgi:1,4-dihydroxy-2-naphthoyl-CoA synthase
MPRHDSPYEPATMPRKLEQVIYEKKGQVAYVTLNRLEVRNAYAYAETRSCTLAWARRTRCTARCRALRRPISRFAMAV